MDYEFGKHLEFKEVLKNKEYYAELFSEENKDLKNLLFNLWENNIETYMCCVGHVEDDAAYIMLYLPFNDPKIYNIINSVITLKDVQIRLGKEHKTEKLLIDIRSFSNNFFFKKINDNLNNVKEVKPEIKNIISVLEKFNYKTTDLYYEIINNKFGQKLNVYLNYTKGSKCHLYVINKTLDLKNIKEDANVIDETSIKGLNI